MNAYVAIGIFVTLTILIGVLSKENFKRSIVKENSEDYFEQHWKKFGTRTRYYQVSVGISFILTIIIILIVKFLEK